MQPFEQLEKSWADFHDLPPEGMVACASGTAALHLAFESLQLPPGSEVLCPDYTMVACPRAIAMASLTPVFVDCDERLLMEQTLLPRASGEITSATLAVHVYGRTVDMKDLHARVDATTNRLYVVEDLAEAHGVRPHPDTDAACWSFQSTKHVHGEEGGAVWFRDPSYAAVARELRCLGFTAAHDYVHTPRGHNYRLANALADLILTSLGEFDQEMDRRRTAERLLDAACLPEWKMPPRSGPWIYDLRIPDLTGEVQIQLVTALRAAGFAARYGFKPMSSQLEFKACRTVGTGNALVASREVIYLPMRDESVAGIDLIRRLLS